MTASVQTSIVIPVFNKWELTEGCLRSLEKTLPKDCAEVLIIDNASTDATPQQCSALGKKLFGDRFIYHRAEQNLNFGPASNFGARMGQGEFVLFLNNDTIARPCWYEPLIRDFSDYENIAATGPVLLYPPKAPLGATVQHLGVFVTPTLKVGHLYEGILASASLTQKRRFLQIITAACMLMPRALFLEHGGFDEGYINGFEDVDLCVRLWAAGYRMTVNPSARMYHLTSQTPGRHTYELENSLLFKKNTMHHMVPDWHIHLANDGLELQLTPWQTLSPGMPEKQNQQLISTAANKSVKELIQTIECNPLWYDGYTKLAQRLTEHDVKQGAHAAWASLTQLRPLPEYLFSLLESAHEIKDSRASDFAVNNLFQYCFAFERYAASAADMQNWSQELGLASLSLQYTDWIAQQEIFRTQTFLPFLQKMREMTRHAHPSPLVNWAYTLWRELQDLPTRNAKSAAFTAPAAADATQFSVLMPVYNPKPEHLRAAVQSLLAQEWHHWELCMADDASPDPQIRPLIEELVALDPRIRVEFRTENGNISAATNTALAMARHDYAALMDQDDLLTPDALRIMAEAITAHPDGLLFYSDEDKVLDDGSISDPYFKSDWDAELLHSQNFVNHLGIYVTSLLREIGGFRLGFEGSQDHDMLFRYTEGGDESRFVHVPKILYHWRAHAGSAAADIASKPQALGSALRALQEHMDRSGTPGVAEQILGTQCIRPRYALPSPAPLVSLIVDLGVHLPLAQAMSQALHSKSGYPKVEILLAYDAEADPVECKKLTRWAENNRQARIVPISAAHNAAERANAAVQNARGGIVGFLGKGVIPLTADWLSYIVGHLSTPGIAALGGMLLYPHNRICNCGYVSGAEDSLYALFRGISHRDPGYFTWPALSRTVPAVDPRCFFVHTKDFTQAKGFDATLAHTGALDLSLRLQMQNRKTIITPSVEFTLSMEVDAPWEHDGRVTEQPFAQRWKGRITPCNPNLTAGDTGWAMHWEHSQASPTQAPLFPLPGMQKEPQAPLLSQEALHGTKIEHPQPQAEDADDIAKIIKSNILDEAFYLSANLDVAASGIPAWEHFILHGMPEGRSPNAHFDTHFYMLQFPQMETASELVTHYVKNGKSTGAYTEKPKQLINHNNGEHEELGDAAQPPADVALLAWYLPQFHPTGVNDWAWGKGFTEWTNTAKATPRFEDHYQPRQPGALGFYDLRLKETLYEQAALAKHAGIHGFVFHHYWFHGKKALNIPLEHLKNDPKIPLRFCLHWANESWTRRWNGSNLDVILGQEHSPEDDIAFISDIAWALRDERYIRMQGKPMLGVYRPELFPDMAATVERWRTWCKDNGIGDIFLFLAQSFSTNEKTRQQYHFDALVEYPPHQVYPAPGFRFHKAGRNYAGTIHHYPRACKTFLAVTAEAATTPRFRGVMPSWDNSPRSATGCIFDGSSPDLYQKWLTATLALSRKDTYESDKFIFINAWNEWAESAYLEPDARYGFANINATARAMGAIPLHLPRVVIATDLNDAAQIEITRQILQNNERAPLMRPVVLSLSVIRNIGTFEGLAPLVVTESVDTPLAQVLATAGFRGVSACLYTGAAEPIILEALAGISPCRILCNSAHREKKSRSSQRSDQREFMQAELPIPHTLHDWNIAGSPFHVLLDTAKPAKPELSVILWLPGEGDISLKTLMHMQQHSTIPMEILLPESIYDACLGHLQNIRSVPDASPPFYREKALSMAQGDAVWFFTPGAALAPYFGPAMMRAMAFAHINCARCYGPEKKDCIPHILDNATCEMSGDDIINSATIKKMPLLPSPSHAFFRTSALQALPLTNLCKNENFVMLLAKELHTKHKVAVVPGELLHCKTPVEE